ncbi:MAG: IPT/TIG domain-containing protein [Planctomycetota bacterium]
MKCAPALILVLIVTLAGLAAEVRGEAVGVLFEPSEVLITSLASVDDEDPFVFDGLAGTSVRLKVSRSKRSALVPTAILLSPDGTTLDTGKFERSGRKSFLLNGFVLPVTGRYTVVVRSANGEPGAYRIRLRVRPPRRFREPRLEVGPGGYADISIGGVTGARLKVRIRARIGSTPRALALLDPSGQEVSDKTASFIARGSRLKGTVDLESGVGEYVLRIGNVGSRAVYDVRMRVRFPKPKRGFRVLSAEEPRIASVVPFETYPGGQVTVYGEGFDSATRVLLRDADVETWLVSPSELQIVTPSAMAGLADLTVIAQDAQGYSLRQAVRIVEAPLDAMIAFPPLHSVTHAEEMTVVGTASHELPGAVKAVRLNGVPATSDDGFATWQATVPISPGTNRLVVTTEDKFGNIVEVTTEGWVRNVGPTMRSPELVASDPANGRAFVFDAATAAILSVDLETGQRTPISDEVHGIGPRFVSPRGMALDLARGRALLADDGLDALLAVDLATGDRSLLSESLSVTDVWAPGDLEFDSVGDRAFVLDAHRKTLVVVDPLTGVRTVVSGEDLGTGPTLLFPAGIGIDPASGRVLVGDSGHAALLAIDPATGDRTEISGPTRGTGPGLRRPLDLVVDAGRALVVDAHLEALVEVDLGTGDRTIVSDAAVGSGPAFHVPAYLALDGGGRAIVADQKLTALLTVDLDTGDRAYLGDSSSGSGAPFLGPTAAVLEVGRNRALVVDGMGGALHAIGLLSGTRQLISDAQTGTGPVLEWPVGIALDGANDRVIVADHGRSELLAVDLDTGDRTLVSGESRGSGPSLESLEDLSLDIASGRAIVVDSRAGALIAVDLTSGDRTLVSGEGTGSGTDFSRPVALAFDPFKGTALVSDLGTSSVVEVDLATGNRTPFSGESRGTGPEIRLPLGLTLDPARGRVLLVDGETDAVLSIDRQTGDRMALCGGEDGQGPDFWIPHRVSLDIVRNLAVVVDLGARAVYLSDLGSGDRVIFSR